MNFFSLLTKVPLKRSNVYIVYHTLIIYQLCDVMPVKRLVMRHRRGIKIIEPIPSIETYVKYGKININSF